MSSRRAISWFAFCSSYHKFTRGKDLSRASATDLDCILGSQAVKKKRKSQKQEEEQKAKEEADLKAAEESEDDPTEVRMVGFQQNDAKNDSESEDDKEDKETKEKSHGLVTIKGGSINDYFAKKMAALKAKAKVAEENRVPDENDDYIAAAKREMKERKARENDEGQDEVEEEVAQTSSTGNAAMDKLAKLMSGAKI